MGGSKGWKLTLDAFSCDSGRNSSTGGPHCEVEKTGYCAQILQWDNAAMTTPQVQKWIEQTNMRLGGFVNGKLSFGGTWVFFANGVSDPWSALGVHTNNTGYGDVGGFSQNYSSGHCAPLTAPSGDDPADLGAVRSAISDFVQAVPLPDSGPGVNKVPAQELPWYRSAALGAIVVAAVALLALGLLGTGVVIYRRSRRARAQDADYEKYMLGGALLRDGADAVKHP